MSDSVYLVGAIAISISLVFGLSNHTQRIALQFMDVRSGTIVNVGTTFLILLMLSPAFIELDDLPASAIAWFALAGLIVPSLSMSLHTWAVQLLGPAVTAAITSTSPVFAIALALGFLGESGDLRLFIGTAIIIGGIGFIALRSRGVRTAWPIWAVLLPLGAALGRAIAHNVTKLGLNALPSPMTATMVGTTVSVIVLGLWQVSAWRPMPRWSPGYGWFGLCGLLNCIGLIGLNVALEMGSVSLVSPLIATTPVSTLLIGWLFFRKDVVGWSTVAAIAAIFLGCLLIIIR